MDAVELCSVVDSGAFSCFAGVLGVLEVGRGKI